MKLAGKGGGVKEVGRTARISESLKMYFTELVCYKSFEFLYDDFF